MTYKFDPHPLLAIMHYAFTREDTFKYDITGDHETGVRTFPILDALAGVSVYKEHQVVAVALQLDSVNRMIRLTIAGSDGVKDEVVDHLTKIWEILQALSNEYAKGRPDEYAKRRPDECGRRSPEIPEDVGLPLRQDLFRNVYKFSLRRHMKRVEKWWPVLVFFMSELHKRRKGVVQDILDQHLNRVSSGLSRLLKAFEKLYEYPQKDLTDDEWKMMFSQDAFVAYSTKLALENRGGEGLETLTNELEVDRLPPSLRIHRALEKLTSFSRHIDTLISFAHSPRFRPALRYTMSISTVPKQTRTIQLPTSPNQWVRILRDVAYESHSRQLEVAENLSWIFPPWENVCPVHSECALIRYLEIKSGSPWDSVLPFSYIGVSKFSCLACHRFIEAFNELGGRRFCTKGWRTKWCWPWGMPKMGESLDKAMVNKVSQEYIGHLKKLKRRRLGC